MNILNLKKNINNILNDWYLIFIIFMIFNIIYDI